MDVEERLRQLEDEIKNLSKPVDTNPPKEKWGLVLAGGGGKGAFQSGAFKALVERGIFSQFAGISGCSVGALNMVLFAHGDVAMAQDVWKNISNDQFLKIDTELIDLKEGIFSRTGLEKLMDDYINFDLISDYKYPLFAATSVFKANSDPEPLYIPLKGESRENIKTILLASSALPYAYENVIFNSMVLKDGGITDNTPIKPLYDLGIRHFYVIDLSASAPSPSERYKDCVFVHIKPFKNIGGLIDGTLDFTAKGAKLRMELGYLDTIRTLDFLDKDLSKKEVLQVMNIRGENEYNQVLFDQEFEKNSDYVNNSLGKIKDIYDRFLSFRKM